ncbi:MAG: phage tail protein [Pseudomonadota bacterium]
MADDGSIQDTPVWPLPKFHFEVRWGDVTVSFQEVSGLDVETEALEYRADANAVSSKNNMPGMIKSDIITLKRGIAAKGNALFDWFAQIKMTTTIRKALTISLLDEAGRPTMIWKVKNAFPVKVSGTDLWAEGNEVAVEIVEIAHEGLVVENT